jgi:hypothetical protein
MLPLGEFSENFLLYRWKSRRAGDKPRVPRFQALQGVVGLKSGIGLLDIVEFDRLIWELD